MKQMEQAETHFLFAKRRSRRQRRPISAAERRLIVAVGDNPRSDETRNYVASATIESTSGNISNVADATGTFLERVPWVITHGYIQTSLRDEKQYSSPLGTRGRKNT